MAVNFKLSARYTPEDDPVVDRPWIGWDDDLTNDEMFEMNRGVWRLNERRIRHERFATFSHNGEIKFVAAINGLEPFATDRPDHQGKSWIVGQLLDESDPIAIAFNTVEVDSFRNPVTYLKDPDGPPGPQTCACGCGTPTGGRIWVTGHDQKALHERINEEWGGVKHFIEWYDSEYRNS